MRRYTLQKNISRLMAVLLCLTMVLSMAPAVQATESGSCGTGLTWTLADGILTIEGIGDMTDFTEETMAPWYAVRNEIRKIILPEGLTRIGDLAFYDCNRLTSADVPDTVTSIGKFAFAQCEMLQLLDLGNGLQSIGNDAFHGCWRLKNVVLPHTLQSIGSNAFYDCASLTSIVIPPNVSRLGSAVFAYCTSLVRAEIQTKITKLPEWTFFGCSQLSTLILPETISEMGNAALRECDDLSNVSYGGSSMSKDQLDDAIAEDVPGFGSTGSLTTDVLAGPSIGAVSTENPDGSVSEKITTVNSGENSTVSSTIDRTFIPDSDNTVSSDITVTVENEAGWGEAQEGVQDALHDLSDREQPGTNVGSANITVYIKDSDTLNGEFIESLAGRDVNITVVTKDGSTWKINCANLVGKKLSGAYDLRYTLEPADEKAMAMMGVAQGYRIRFAESAAIEAELLILLPNSAIRQTATLFQQESANEMTRFQSVVVDSDGYAHLYLAAVDRNTAYYLGINAPGAQEEAFIPEDMQNQAAPLTNFEPIQYEITGRTSSWNMGLGKVMGILAGVMIGVIVLVGGIMFIWNKKRLESGYMPQWDDDEE